MEVYTDKVARYLDESPKIKLIVETIRSNKCWPLFIAAPTKCERLEIHTALRILTELTGNIFNQQIIEGGLQVTIHNISYTTFGF